MADDSVLKSQNIIAGSGKLYLGATGNRVILGHTTGGIAVTVSRDMFDIESDQVKAIVRKELQLSKMMFKTRMLETDVENLQLIWNEPTANLDTSSNLLTIGIASVVQRELLGMGPGKQDSGNVVLTRSIRCWQAVAFDTGEMSWSRTEASSIEVSFEILYDDAKSSFAQIRDWSAVPWSLGIIPGGAAPTGLGI